MPVRCVGCNQESQPLGGAANGTASLEPGAWTPFRNLLVWFAVTLIRGYQFAIRPFLVGCCKFYPTCSDYAVQAIQSHGPLRGGWLAVRRIARCHPFTPGGLDPVPSNCRR